MKETSERLSDVFPDGVADRIRLTVYTSTDIHFALEDDLDECL